jgi:hypothetical protein
MGQPRKTAVQVFPTVQAHHYFGGVALQDGRRSTPQFLAPGCPHTTISWLGAGWHSRTVTAAHLDFLARGCPPPQDRTISSHHISRLVTLSQNTGFSHGPGGKFRSGKCVALFLGLCGTQGLSPQHTSISWLGGCPPPRFLASGHRMISSPLHAHHDFLWVALQDCHRSTPRFPGFGGCPPPQFPATAGQDDFLPPTAGTISPPLINGHENLTLSQWQS